VISEELNRLLDSKMESEFAKKLEGFWHTGEVSNGEDQGGSW